ncbi:HvfC/BufC N-terminal domain-containing protein [Marinobacterium arenosum]|uniref:HvfC/BufC N-terminal domain-containing protein n=1 Tax=Marinobacterium arenosum TaxID=2862496 RepID=UPI001C97D25F|nr:putative DNA-binding domain-containing protein [Marinobacterium arenosum]MBY4677313.1 DNA-binding domain-containing protein [Marinobacterium arenosum]
MTPPDALQRRQRQLLAYLRGQHSAIDRHIVDQGAVDGSQRLAIYRNAYRSRLRETLETDHPILGLYLGDQLFERMVDDYIDQCPSNDRSLRQFADRLPQFLRDAEPFRQYPQIAELCRFERALLSAFDAADAPRASADQLRQLSPEQWPPLTLSFHPSVQLFSSDFNVVPVWQALKAEQTPPQIRQAREHWLLWRNAERLTEFCSISPLERQLLCACLQGDDLAAAAELLIGQLPAQDAGETLLNSLLGWLERGWIQQLKTPAQTAELTLV